MIAFKFGGKYVVLGAALAIACNQSPTPQKERPGSAAIQTTSLALNANPKTSDFVIEASNSLRLQTGSGTHAGDVASRGAGAGPFLSGGVPLDVLGGGIVDGTHNVIADSVHLGSGAVVGDVQTAHFSGSGSVHGQVSGLVALPALPAASPMTAGTTNVTVGALTTVSKAPGRYGSVTVNGGGILRLGAGLYEVASVTVASAGRIEATGSVQIQVAGRWSYADGAFLGSAQGTGLTARGVRVEISGQNGTNGALSSTPKAATFGNGDVVRALVLVPNGELSLATGAVATGAFFARDIDVGTGAQLTFEDGFPACTAVSCDDSNPCTIDGCGANGCTHSPAASGSSCSDGNACNGTETCNATGTCTAGTPPALTDNNSCTTDSCAPATGVTHTPVADGSSCSDGNVCNGAELCGGGACRSGTAPILDDQNPCTADSCDPTTGVAHTPVAPGTSCADGNVCNGTESCNASGACAAGTPLSSDDGNPCTADTCDPTTGVHHAPAADGTACNDGNACTSGDACVAGTCAGAGIVTSDGNPCTVDACDPILGVTHQPVAAGTSCSDGNACNGAETCSVSGTCQAGAPPSTDDQNPCTTDSCDSVLGVRHVPVATGTSCSDGNPCNGAETCSATGTCTAGTSPVLTDNNPCTTDSCAASTGVTHTPVADGASCSDGNACNGAETCPSGSCGPGTAPVVNDHNPCTADSCDPTTGVVHAPVTAGTACSDGDACNGAETCDAAGTCVGGQPPVLTDNNPCTTDACSPSSGVTHTAVADGTSCADGNACNGVEVCSAGACTPGAPPTVDDGNACTVDSCDPATGVTHLPATTGTTCGTAPDGCHVVPSCDAAGACQPGGVVPAGTTCAAPSDACHSASTCDAVGACQPGSAVNVDDSNPCTTDSCDPASGPAHVPVAVGTTCGTAADACHGASTCDGSGACRASTPVPTDDGNPCTTDSCDPSSGPMHVPAAVGTVCAAAADACHDPGTCNAAGSCRPSAPTNVDDNDSCTVDSCSTATGPVHSPLAAGTLCGPSSFCDASGGCIVRIPPDPATVAPAVDTTTTSALFDRTGFLYTGNQPIQTGVSAGTIEARRTSLIRGRVLDHSSNPLPGATVQVLGHPELGGTATRADGAFDLVVNGGGRLILRFAGAGLLAVERGVIATWNDSVVMDDVVLLPIDPNMTPVTLESSSTQVAAGSAVTDQNGTRRAIVVFQPGTTAEMILPSGASEPLDAMSVHVTEYTKGPIGPASMPGDLPATSGYTYAVSLSAEEAEAAGAQSIHFSTPVSLYVDDFLHFGAGTIMPAGSYDQLAGDWVPEPNGRVIMVLSVQGGVAALDVDGSGNAAGASALSALGITDAERAQLAQIYAAGVLLWRVPVAHWSALDANMPEQPDDPNGPGPAGPAGGGGPGSGPPGGCGSFIELTNQILGESISVAGTPMKLSYRSDRTPGRREQYRLHIPVSGAPAPPGPADTTLGYEVDIYVAGRRFQQTFPAAPNQTTDFEWDGLDAYGRQLQGIQPAVVFVSRIVPANYVAPSSFGAAFAQYSGTGTILTGDRARKTISITKRYDLAVGGFDARPQAVAGWTLDVHHSYDPSGGVLYLGTGDRRQTGALGNVIEQFAGNGATLANYEGIPALQAEFPAASGIAIGADRAVYMTTGDSKVLRIDPKTTIVHRIAGSLTGQNCPLNTTCGDGGPALNAQFNFGTGLAVGRDNSIYLTELVGNGIGTRNSIRKIDPSGNVSTFAGLPTTSSSCTFQGDGGPASNAEICTIYDIALGPDGSLYTIEEGNDIGNGRVRKIGTDGIMRTLVSNVTTRDGGVAVGPDGTVYYSDSLGQVVHRITPGGTNSVFAGSVVFDAFHNGPAPGYSGDGGPATQARLAAPTDVEVAPNGIVYIFDRDNAAIRVVTPDGVINTLAGGNPSQNGLNSGDGGPALQGVFAHGSSFLAFGPDGALYTGSGNVGEVRRVRSALPGGVLAANILLPSDDGQAVYEFDQHGRHLRTRHALTGGTLWTFGYDPAGHLTTATDGDGNVTTIARDPTGAPTTITGPYGHVTTLNVDAEGFLASARDPSGAEYDFTYTDDGLLTAMLDANAGLHSFSWDADGRLTRDENPAGGFQTLARTLASASDTVTVQTAQNIVSTYKTEQLPTGQERRTFAREIPTPTVTLLDFNKQTETTTQPDGMQFLATKSQAPRWGMTGPITVQTALTTPSGTSLLTGDSQSVALSTQSDPFSVTSFVDNATTNSLLAKIAFAGPGKTLTFTSPAGRTTTTTLDALGRPVQVAVPGVSPVTFFYDSRGRPQSVTQGSRTTTTSYDPLGNVQAATDALSQVESFDHDAVGRVIARHRADGTVVAFGYDLAGNLTSVTPPGKPAHLFTYDAENRLATYTAPDAGTGPAVTGYTYDLDGHPTAVTRPDGSTVTMGYDTSGRMQTATFPSGTMTLGYNSTTGKLTSATGPYGVNLGYGYDGKLLTSTAWSGAVTGSVARTYDSFFRVATETINGQAATKATLGYDNDGLVTSVATPAGSMALTYDPTAPRLQTTTLGSVTDSRTYDPFGQAASYTAKFGSTVLYDVSYGRDALGRIQQKVETIQGDTKTTEYGYDQVGRLVTVAENGATVRQYTYDDNGNRTRFDDVEHSTSTTGTYDAQDRLLTYGTLTYTYTKDGALRTKTDSSNGQTTTYTYDAIGNLTHVDLPDGRAIDYVVDGDGRRVGKKINGVLQKQWLYADDLRVVAELDGAGNVVSRFVWADGTGASERVVRQVFARLGLKVPVLLQDALRSSDAKKPLRAPAYEIRGGVLYRILSDNLGTPRLTIAVSSGSVAEQFDVDEWGDVLNDTSPGFQPFGLAAGLYDPDTRLVRFGARDYELSTGRWTGKDPFRFGGGQVNTYAYVSDDPINLRDPYGYASPGEWASCAAGVAWCAFLCVTKDPECGNCMGTALADCPDFPDPFPPSPNPQPQPPSPPPDPLAGCKGPDAGVPACTGPEPDICQ